MFSALALALLAPIGCPAGNGNPASEGGPRLHALLVGCSEYPYLREALGEETYAREVLLAGPVADVELMRGTLAHVLGLEPRHTRVLVGWGPDEAARPTRVNVLDALAQLAEAVQPGERAIVYLAGHGSQQRVSRQQDGEADGLDEVFLAADARPAKDGHIPNSIRDDELGAAVRAIRDAGAEVWLLVDACHSGSMLRGGEAPEGLRLRGIDPALLGVTSGLRGGGGRKRSEQASWIGNASSERIAAMYGAQSYGRAPELPTPRGGTEVHGLFSWVVCQELERTGGSGTYQELYERVVAAYQAFPCSITIPAAEGELLREVATGKVVDGPTLLCVLRGGQPWLNQGRLAGICAGTVAALVSHGTPRGDSIGPTLPRVLARVEVLAADPFEASCRWLDDVSQLDLGSVSAFPAVIERRMSSDWRMPLALVRPDGTPLALERAPEVLRAALAAESERFPLVTRGEADWWVVLNADGGVWLRPGPREGGYDLFDLRMESLGADLRRIQTTRNLRRCSSELLAAGWSGELDVWIEHKAPGGRPRRLRPGDVIHPLDQIRVLLAKSSARIFDVQVFYLDARFGRTRLFPRAGASPRLEAEARSTSELTKWLTVVDDGLGLEQLLVLATPREASSPQLDLAWLAQEGTLRGAGGGALDGLLASLRGGGDLRGQSFGSSAEVEGTQSLLVSLSTEWRPLAAPPWPRAEIQGFEARPESQGKLVPAGLPDSIPDFWSAGSRAALGRSEAIESGVDLLFLGDQEVRAVLIDFDGDGLGPEKKAGASECGRERRFDAEVAFLFTGEGRYAYYDSRGTGALDLVLVDRDEDGVAEERHVYSGAGWRSSSGIAVPWSSQVHLPRGLGGSAEDRTARLALLQPKK